MSSEEQPAPEVPTRNALAAAVATAFVLTFAFRWVTAAFPNDHFTHLTRARQIVMGEFPIRDFFDPGQFLHYYLSAGMQVLFGFNLFGEAILTIGFIAVGAAITCGVASRLSGSIAIGLGAATLSVMSFPRLYNYPKVFIYPAAIWAIWRYAQRPSRGNLAWLALISAVAFLFRFDHGAYVVAAMFVLLLLVHVDRLRSWLSATVTYGVLCALLLVPFAIYVEWAQGVGRYIEDEISAARLVGNDMTGAPPVHFTQDSSAPTASSTPASTAPAATAPAPSQTPAPPTTAAPPAATPEAPRADREERTRALSTLTMLLRRIVQVAPAMRPPPADLVNSPQTALWWFHYVVVAIPYLAFLFCAGAWWRGRIDRREAAAIAASAFMCYVIGRTLVRSNPYARLADVAAPMAILGAWVAGRFLTVSTSGAFPFGSPSVRRVLFAAFCAATFWGVALQAQLGGVFRSAHLFDGPQAIRAEFSDVTRDLQLRPIDYWSPPDQRDGLRALVRYVMRCTAPSDRLVVTGIFAPEAAFYAERRFGGGQVHFLGGWHNSLRDQRLTIERLRSQSVPIVLAVQSGNMERSFPWVQRYIDQAYHEVPLPPVAAAGEQPWHLLVDSRRTPLGTDPVLELPCYRDPPGHE